MTNAEIILKNSCQLMKDGIIGTTGRILTMKTDDGKEITMPEPEPIHTFQMWKELGYSVKKGEHAIAKIRIWKYHIDKEIMDENGEKEEEAGSCFMKTAFFFKRDQVEPINA